MAALEGTVEVPGAGRIKKTYVLAGVAAVLALVIYQRYKASHSAPGAPGAAAGLYPPDGTTGNPNDPYSVDPATGQTYGNEASGQYGAGSYGAGAGTGYGGGGGTTGDPYPWDGTTGNPSDPYSLDPATNTTYGDEGYVTGVTPGTGGGPPFGTNAQWSQYAQNYLTGTVGLDPAAVSSALGAYLTGSPVTAAQEDIINQAIAAAGQPPVTGPNGYPPSIHVQGTKTGGGSGGGGHGGGGKPGPVTGLHASARYTQADLSWLPVRGATGYRVRVWDHGSHIVSDTRQPGTHLTLHNLARSTTYGWHVQALNSAGGGPWSGNAHFKTQ